MRAIRCVYCGAPADTRDHVIPRAYARRNSAHEAIHKAGDWTVPACSECNTNLSARLLFTVPDRAAYLLARFERKWAKLLKTPDWSPAEIEETEGFFRQALEGLAAQKLEAQARLDRLSLVASMDASYLAPAGWAEEILSEWP